MANLVISQTTYLLGGARAFGDVYSNLSSNTVIRVSISINITLASNFVFVQCDTSNPPTTIVAKVKGQAGDVVNLVFEVPQNYYYLVTASGSPTIAYWNESIETLT